MDPLSIVSASAGILGACIKSATAIHDFISNTKNVDGTIQSLHHDVTSLQAILENICGVLKYPNAKEAITRSCEEYSGNLWSQTKKVLDTCEVTLSRLDKIFEKLGKMKKGTILQPWRQIQFQLKAGEIEVHQQHIRSQRGMLQVILASVTL
jgi:hypothetical protein